MGTKSVARMTKNTQSGKFDRGSISVLAKTFEESIPIIDLLEGEVGMMTPSVNALFFCS